MTASAWRGPMLWAGLVLLFQVFPTASTVRDAATMLSVSGYRFVPSAGHLATTPFSVIADTLSVLSQRELVVSAVWIVSAILLLLRGWHKAVGLLMFLGFVGWGVLVPRPMAKLAAADPDVLLVDFHSHTALSHDGRPSFTYDRNRAWHRRQGYGAGFITDHNQTGAAEDAFRASQADAHLTGYHSLRGEEISLFKTHLVVLGNEFRIDHAPYDGDPAGVERFIKEARRQKLPVIASLPEYWWYHDRPGSPGGSLEDFIRWGITGIEIVNSAPRALDFPLAERRKVVELAAAHHLFLTGISDNHGYGSATAAWNAMTFPGWRTLPTAELEKEILRLLETDKGKAVQVLERSKFQHETMAGLLISTPANFILMLRGLSWSQALVFAGWISLLALPAVLKRIRHG